MGKCFCGDAAALPWLPAPGLNGLPTHLHTAFQVSVLAIQAPLCHCASNILEMKKQVALHAFIHQSSVGHEVKCQVEAQRDPNKGHVICQFGSVSEYYETLELIVWLSVVFLKPACMLAASHLPMWQNYFTATLGPH